MKQRLYIESTVWYQMVNYSSSEYKKRAEQLFKLIEEKKYDIYISNIVLEEIGKNSDRYRGRLEELLEQYKPTVIIENIDTEMIAHTYLEHAYKSFDRKDVICDAYHAALATTANISYMVSYNYKHFLNISILDHLYSVNLIAGYNNRVSILPPFMFMTLETFEGDKGDIDDSVWKIKRKYGEKLIELMDTKSPEERQKYHKDFTLETASRLSLKSVEITQNVTYI